MISNRSSGRCRQRTEPWTDVSGWRRNRLSWCWRASSPRWRRRCTGGGNEPWTGTFPSAGTDGTRPSPSSGSSTTNTVRIRIQFWQLKINNFTDGGNNDKIDKFLIFNHFFQVLSFNDYSTILGESEKQIIRDAFTHWEEHTCIRFQEIPFEQTERGNHLMITKEATGCHSYVGRTSFIPQVINLQASCLWQVSKWPQNYNFLVKKI